MQRKYTIDASVWVNGFDKLENGHDISRQFLNKIKQLSLPLIVPRLLIVEVAGAISRSRKDKDTAKLFAKAISKIPNATFVPTDCVLSKQATELAIQYKLRGADAIYAAVAAEHECILVSLDNEHLTRLNGLITVLTPANALIHMDVA